MSRRDRLLESIRAWGSSGPKRSLGQNFLVSDHVIEKILAAARAQPAPAMIEVGPGLGAMTEDLIAQKTPLWLIELDREFAEGWRQRATTESHLQVIEGDALQVDWAAIGLPRGTLFVSNLPYQISSSVVIERCVQPAGITRMILMFQKEVAQRLAAQPSTKEYGLLTVIAQTFWQITKVVDANPLDFFPPPNVSSRVMQFSLRTPAPEVDPQAYLDFVKSAFSQRRKLLVRNLQTSYFNGSKEVLPQLEEIFTAHKLLRTARAEELDPVTFVRLYQAIQSGGGRKGLGQ